MEEIKREDINKDTPLYVVVKYLSSVIEDKCPRDRIDDYELGTKVGELKVIDMLRSMI